MIEPGIADIAAREEFDWSTVGKCRVCLAQCGEGCVALNGRVAGSRPDGIVQRLSRPHASRPVLRRR